MIFKPEFVAGIAKYAHPYGCRQSVLNQIEYVKGSKQFGGPKKVLVIGASSGFGLATRISLAFGGAKADTVGISFETGVAGKRTGTAGWYNNIWFKQEAEKEGLIAKNIVGDAFSDEIREETIKYIKENFGKVDLVVYSLASGRRTDPKTGITYTSALKPIGEEYTGATIDIVKEKLLYKTIPPAKTDELDKTIKVMGGEDWRYWIDSLLENDCLSDGAKTITYSYLGTEVTYPIYKDGTIGQAKRDIEKTAFEIDELLKEKVNGQAFVSVNKALVTKASAALPTFPLYAAVLYKVMKAKGVHEDCIMQIQRMFTEKVYSGNELDLDEVGRLRMDDWELREDIKADVAKIWDVVNVDNFTEYSDYKGYKDAILEQNGFAIPDVDYEEDIDIEKLKKLTY